MHSARRELGFDGVDILQIQMEQDSNSISSP
jgi:hypothetical protein